MKIYRIKFYHITHSTLWFKKIGERGMIQKGKEDSEVMLLLCSLLCFKHATNDQGRV